MADVAVEDELMKHLGETRGEWYIIHTLSGYENRVRDAILRRIGTGDDCRIYDAFVPCEHFVEIKEQKKTLKTKKCFPGYVFVRVGLYDEITDADGGVRRRVNDVAWQAIREINGVMSFLCDDRTHPVATPLDQVEVLLRKTFAPPEEAAPQVNFKLGEMVAIKDGAFSGTEGTVCEIDQEHGKLKLSVNMFGRNTLVELEFWQVGRLN